MEFITNWASNIIIFILLATIIEMLLPNGDLHKYTKLVIGLLLIILIVTPILNVFSLDVEKVLASVYVKQNSNEEILENNLEMKKKEIQASQRAYILEQMAVQMKTHVEEELVNQYDIEVLDVFLSLKEDTEWSNNPQAISEVQVSLKEKQNEQVVSAIKPVKIDTASKNRDNQMEQQNIQELKMFLSKEWGLEPNQIVLLMEGGDLSEKY